MLGRGEPASRSASQCLSLIGFFVFFSSGRRARAWGTAPTEPAKGRWPDGQTDRQAGKQAKSTDSDSKAENGKKAGLMSPPSWKSKSASKQASKQAGKQASKQGGRQAKAKRGAALVALERDRQRDGRDHPHSANQVSQPATLRTYYPLLSTTIPGFATPGLPFHPSTTLLLHHTPTSPCQPQGLDSVSRADELLAFCSHHRPPHLVLH